MESNNTIIYDVDKSADRMGEILNASNDNYSEKDSVLLRKTHM